MSEKEIREKETEEAVKSVGEEITSEEGLRSEKTDAMKSDVFSYAESGGEGRNIDGDGGNTAVENSGVKETDNPTDNGGEKVLTEKEKKKKTRNKILGYILFVGISAAVILAMILFEDRSGDPVSGKEAFILLGQNPLYTFLAFVSFFIIVFTDIIAFRVLTSKLKTGCSLSTCVSVSFLGRYFDRVTPWATGGEPFQVLYLHKAGLKSGDSCAVTMSRHIIRFFSVAIAVIAILASSGIVTNIYVMIAAIVSVLGGLVVPVFMLICAFRPKIGRKISDGVIGFLHKIKIVKNREKAATKVHGSVEQFLSGVKYLSVNKGVIIVLAICALAEMFINNSVPYFVMKALGVPDVQYWETLVLCLFVNYASSFAPTPGGAGIAELSFYAIFASHIEGGLLFWAVLFWRIAVFYIPVFIGFIMQTAGSVKAIIKIKKES